MTTAEKTTAEFTLDKIDDNPYQPRKTYHKKDIEELAESIRIHGQLQPALGRPVDGRVELAFGHMRKRALLHLYKEDPTKHTMWVDLRILTDEEMAMMSLEENLKRTDITRSRRPSRSTGSLQPSKSRRRTLPNNST